MIRLKKFFTPLRKSILSQVFINLAAGWFGIVLIIPGITKLESIEDIFWLTKNVFFGILSLGVAEILSKKKRK